MFERLLTYLDPNASLPEDQVDLIRARFQPAHLVRGTFLLREGEVARYGAFVVNGCLRSYAIDNKGKEHILQFAPEDWWIGNLESSRNETPSAYFIDAIEDSDVFLIDKDSFQKLLEKVPAFAASFQTGLQRHTSAKDKRIIGALSTTAEERYRDFLMTYPSIAQRIPQHMLAAYLGISPETLSRIRKHISRKK